MAAKKRMPFQSLTHIVNLKIVMKKATVVSITIILLSIMAILFIKKSNDHLECNNESVTIENSNGEIITTNKHICKEKYSL